MLSKMPEAQQEYSRDTPQFIHRMKRPLKVLHIMRGRERGGIGTLWIDLAPELERQGLDVAGLVLEDGLLAEKIRSAGVSLDVLSCKNSSRLQILRGIQRFIHENQITMVHTHGIGSNIYGRLIKLMGCRMPLITSIHADMLTELLGALRGWQARLYYRIERSMRFLTDHFIAVCHASARTYIQEGISSRKMHVIHNGISVGPVPVGRDDSLRKRLGIPQGAKIVGTVGRLTEVKNQALLIKCLPDLLDKVPDLFLLLVGNGYLKDFLEHLAEEEGISHRVIFAGWQKDVHALMQLMDVFVLPSLKEGLPISLLEAMMCQRPIVATNVGGIPEVIQDGRSGLLVPHDREKMAAAIHSLLMDSEMADRMAQNGRRIIEKKFSVQRMAKDLMAFYKEVHNRWDHPQVAGVRKEELL